MQKGVFVSNKSQMENPLSAEKKPMDDQLGMDIDNDDEFASRLDDMYQRSQDGNQMASVFRSGPVRFFCSFWTNRNRNRLPNTEIQKKTGPKPQKTAKNRKKPVRTSSNATS